MKRAHIKKVATRVLLRIIFLPLIFVVVWMGVYPQPFFDIIHGSVANLIDNYQAAVGGAPTTALLQ